MQAFSEEVLDEINTVTDKFLIFQILNYCQTNYKDTDLVTFTEEILNGKLHFLCSEIMSINNYFILNGTSFNQKHFPINIVCKS